MARIPLKNYVVRMWYNNLKPTLEAFFAFECNPWRVLGGVLALPTLAIVLAILGTMFYVATWDALNASFKEFLFTLFTALKVLGGCFLFYIMLIVGITLMSKKSKRSGGK